MRRGDRLFEIIQLLRNAKRPLTAAQLAATLEVNVRTVYRDIAALQARRVPIEGAAGVGYAHGGAADAARRHEHGAVFGVGCRRPRGRHIVRARSDPRAAQAASCLYRPAGAAHQSDRSPDRGGLLCGIDADRSLVRATRRLSSLPRRTHRRTHGAGGEFADQDGALLRGWLAQRSRDYPDQTTAQVAWMGANGRGE